MDPLFYGFAVVGVIVGLWHVFGVFSVQSAKNSSSACPLQIGSRLADGNAYIRVSLRMVCSRPHPHVVFFPIILSLKRGAFGNETANCASRLAATKNSRTLCRV